MERMNAFQELQVEGQGTLMSYSAKFPEHRILSEKTLNLKCKFKD